MAACSIARAFLLWVMLGPLLAGASTIRHPPTWMDEIGQRAFYILEAQKVENTFSVAACGARQTMLEKSAGVDDGNNDQEAAPFRIVTITGIGLCEMKKEQYGIAAEMFDMAIKQTMKAFDFASAEELADKQGLSKIFHMQRAAAHLDKGEKKEAALNLRKARAALDTENRAFLIKIVGIMEKKEMSHTPDLQEMFNELAQYGEEGEHLPMLLEHVPQMKIDLAFAKLVDQLLTPLNKYFDSDEEKKGYSLEL